MFGFFVREEGWTVDAFYSSFSWCDSDFGGDKRYGLKDTVYVSLIIETIL